MNVWVRFYKILLVFEVPYRPLVKGMPGKKLKLPKVGKGCLKLERVKGVAKTLKFSLGYALSSHSSQWFLCILTRDWYYIQKGSKLLICTLISLLKQHFLLLINFCIYFERCSNFEFEAVWIFYVIVFQCKWVSGVGTYEAKIAADSIIWELFARKSAECLNLRNSFITISTKDP